MDKNQLYHFQHKCSSNVVSMAHSNKGDIYGSYENFTLALVQ